MEKGCIANHIHVEGMIRAVFAERRSREYLWVLGCLVESNLMFKSFPVVGNRLHMYRIPKIM